MSRLRLCLDCRAHLTPRSVCEECQRERDATKNAKSYYQTAEWRRLSARAIRRDGECLVCAHLVRLEDGGALVAHHVIGRAHGGPDILQNLVTLCSSHHSTYEGLKRAGRATRLTRLVEALGADR
jgi:5-methylcytosine-specific restriction endonuclease McrA